MKIRKDRWDGREHLKFMSNRRGDKKAQHPQVRRQIDDMDDQLKTPSQPSLTNLSDELDKLIKEYGIGTVVCVACKHDVYSHYWNMSQDWDACHALGCNCKGEWDEPQPNTIDSCGWLKREFVPSVEAKLAIAQHTKEAVEGSALRARIDELQRLKQIDAFNEAYSTDPRCSRLVDIRLAELAAPHPQQNTTGTEDR